MKKKYRISKKGKERITLMIWFILTLTIVFISTQIYMQRIKDINDEKITVQCDCNKDK